jgi:hypothetical protein
VDVDVRRGHLVASSPVGSLRGGVRLYALDPDNPLVFETVVRRRSAPHLLRLAFLRDADGRVNELVGHMLYSIELRRRPAVRAAKRPAALSAATAIGAATAATMLRQRHPGAG